MSAVIKILNFPSEYSFRGFRPTRNRIVCGTITQFYSDFLKLLILQKKSLNMYMCVDLSTVHNFHS